MRERREPRAEDLDPLDQVRLFYKARRAGDHDELERLAQRFHAMAASLARLQAEGEAQRAKMMDGPARPWGGQIWQGVHYREGVMPHPYVHTSGGCGACTAT